MITTLVIFALAFLSTILAFALALARHDRLQAESEARRYRVSADAWQLECEHRYRQFTREAEAHRSTSCRADRAERRLYGALIDEWWAGRN